MQRSTRSVWRGGVALAALLCAGPLAAQESAPVAAGARVRVRSDRLRPPVVVGRVRYLTPDTLVLIYEPDAPDVRVPRAWIRRLEVSEGHPGRGRRAVAGAALGLLMGAAVGLGLDDVGCEDCSGREARLTELAPSILFGSVGALAGLLVGWATTSERWAPVAPAASGPER